MAPFPCLGQPRVFLFSFLAALMASQEMLCWRVVECLAPVRCCVKLRVPGPGDVAQLVECLLNLHKAQVGFPALHETSRGTIDL